MPYALKTESLSSYRLLLRRLLGLRTVHVYTYEGIAKTLLGSEVKKKKRPDLYNNSNQTSLFSFLCPKVGSRLTLSSPSSREQSEQFHFSPCQDLTDVFLPRLPIKSLAPLGFTLRKVNGNLPLKNRTTFLIHAAKTPYKAKRPNQLV